MTSHTESGSTCPKTTCSRAAMRAHNDAPSHADTRTKNEPNTCAAYEPYSLNTTLRWRTPRRAARARARRQPPESHHAVRAARRSHAESAKLRRSALHVARGSWRAGFHSGGRVCAYALSAELNTIASARTFAERIACTSRSRVSLGAPRSTRRPRRRPDGRVSFTSRTAIDTSDVASSGSSPPDLSDSTTP
jgi:hypothetical protein